MRKSVGSLIILLLLAIAVSIGIGCRDDVFVDPPPSLTGRYHGIYTVITIANGIDTIKYRSQYVDFTFLSEDWLLDWDDVPPNRPPDDDSASFPNARYFCDPGGIYQLENGVIFDLQDETRNPVVCTFDDNPDGKFSLDQSRGDTIYLEQISLNSSSNEVVKRLRLVNDTIGS